MIIVKPSKDILQLNKGFRFERNSTAFDEQGKLFYPHNARFQAGKFGKALLVEEGTTNLITKDFDRWNNNGYHLELTKNDDWDYTIKRLNDTGNAFLSTDIPCTPNTTYCFSVEQLIESNMEQIFIFQLGVQSGIKTSNKSIKSPGKYSNIITTAENDTQLRLYIHCGMSGAAGRQARIRLPQLEQKPYSTTFITGTRSPEIVTIPANTISPTGGQWDHYAYINSTARRQVAGQTPTLFHIPRLDGGMGIRVCHAEDTTNWKLQTMDDTNDITEVDAPDSLTPDGWHRFTVKWTEAEAKLLIDGVVAGTIANPALPSAFAENAFVGSYDGNENFLNTLHDDIRVSNIARADADDLTDYQADQPLPTDSSTIHKQSFDSPNNLYVRLGLVL